jgi:hypothetical protein
MSQQKGTVSFYQSWNIDFLIITAVWDTAEFYGVVLAVLRHCWCRDISDSSVMVSNRADMTSALSETTLFFKAILVAASSASQTSLIQNQWFLVYFIF